MITIMIISSWASLPDVLSENLGKAIRFMKDHEEILL